MLESGGWPAPAPLAVEATDLNLTVASGGLELWFDLRMSEVDRSDGKEILLDLARAAARVTAPYANFQLTEVDDHVVRMSVMTEPFYWHLHPDSDETFLVIEGEILLETENERVALGPGQLYTVPAGLAHVTSPRSPRSVNITIERAGMSTERLTDPPSVASTSRA